ncbi:MAG: hypothetical protein KTR25_13110 [Myxococcales bacterium]|nr:hypothetical protein [Myxococcales bacterium]
MLIVAPVGEGGLCVPGADQCREELGCVDVSLPLTSPDQRTGVCLTECTADGDCDGSSLEPTAAICSANGVCVQELVSEGEIASLDIGVHSRAIQDCPPDTVRFVGFQFGLSPGEYSCVRPCANSDECTTAEYNFCNLNSGRLDEPQAPPGICSQGDLRQAGSPCSTRDASKACSLDIVEQGYLVCDDLFAQYYAQELGSGVCLQVCGDVDNNPETAVLECQNQNPDTTQPTCDYDFLASPVLGLCSDNCSGYPNSCNNTSTTSCVPFLAMCVEAEINATDILTIYDVAKLRLEPPEPPSPDANCAGRENHCPANSFCGILDSGNGTPILGACVLGCNPTLPVEEQGCTDKSIDGVDNLQCVPIEPNSLLGYCQSVPLALEKTSMSHTFGRIHTQNNSSKDPLN